MPWGCPMGPAATPPRANRPLTVDFRDDATSCQRLKDGPALVECGRAFLLALGLQRKQKATCHGGACLPRHAPYVRVRLGGVTIWRLQGTTGRAVCTVRP